MKDKELSLSVFLAAVSFAISSPLAAQTVIDGQVQPAADAGTQIGLIMTVSLLVFVVATLMYIIGVMNSNINPVIDAFIRAKNYVIPQSTEVVQDMGHDFDGIRELDNRIPPWFNYLFGITVLFGIVYMIDYHIAGVSPLQQAEYQQELVAASLQRQILNANEPPLDETQLVALKDDASLTAGREIFQKYCISCHGLQAGGIVGPNLTDQYWIHGGGITNVYQTIKKGVPAKGMISWELVFTQRQIYQIASFVLSLQGSNPPGGKSPEGQLYIEPKIAGVSSDSSKASRKL
ncbi:MAG: cbb3-type cytochrome c oxidase N-terminal domain-containing protein [Bacteroidota bacterium]|jgi:cytochrome c oxidase cbb3-type subunit 3